MSLLEFSLASASVGLKPKAENAARRVLVDGEFQTDVATSMGETRQNVHYWTKRILDVSLRQKAAMAKVAPPGWNARIVTAPPALMRKIELLTEADRLDLIAGDYLLGHRRR